MYKITPTLIKKKPNKEGTYPVKLVIRINGKPLHHSTGIRVKPSQWSGKVENHPNAALFNQTIRKESIEAEQKILELQIRGELTRQNLQFVLKKGERPKEFYPYVENLIKELTGQKEQVTIRRYRTTLKRIQEFAGDSLSFKDITHPWLRRYESFLRSHLANNTVDKHWSVFEFFLNHAVKDKVIKESPVKHYDNKPKYIQTERTFLLWGEVNKLERLLEVPLQRSMRQVLLFSLLGCYTGLRLEDWYKHSPDRIKGDRYILRADKNDRIISIKITPALQKILDLIGSEKLTLNKKDVRLYVKGLASLAGIGKDVHPHCFRHTFVTRCLSKKVPTYRIAQWIGTTEDTVKVYSHLINTEGDQDILTAFG